MTASMLTSTDPSVPCPVCKKSIEDGDKVAVVLISEAFALEDETIKEAELEPGTLGISEEFTDQLVIHVMCFKNVRMNA